MLEKIITINKLKKNKGLYLKVKNLDKILSLLNKFNFYQDNYKFNYKKSQFTLDESCINV